MLILIKKDTRVAFLLPDKVNLQSKEYYQGPKSSLLNGKGVNSPKRRQ